LKNIIIFTKIFILNYLAHIYLSGEEEAVKIGNFAGDYVKGKSYNNFPDGIRFGILLHRKIDTFTDTHSVVKRSSSRLKPAYERFSGAVVDILYDHFLSKNWSNFSDIPLKKYAQNIYSLIEKNNSILPERMQHFIPFFIKRDRLNCYANLECFEDVLLKMGEYTAMPKKSKEGMKIINENYSEFEKDFNHFFIDIQHYVQKLIKLRYAEPDEILGF
jgi:acyl carrier protein phosphodiesterase